MAGTAAVFLVLVAGVLPSKPGKRGKRAGPKARAKQESAIAQAVSDFLQNDLAGTAVPQHHLGHNQTDPDLKYHGAGSRRERIEGTSLPITRGGVCHSDHGKLDNSLACYRGS